MSAPLARFKQSLANDVSEAIGLPSDTVDTIARQIRVPDLKHGDLALACFEVAKHVKQNPIQTAQIVAEKLATHENWLDVEAAGPYVNVRLTPEHLAASIVPDARKPTFGRSDVGKGKTVCIDFSSPNIAKPLAFHHIRSTVIGAALGRLHAANGWTVVGINYLGDWGKQFGLLATGFQRYGDPARRADAKHLIEVYVRANREADVASVKSRIGRPEEAKNWVQLLKETDTSLEGELDKKARKKAQKNKKSLEKKIRELRGQTPDADPLLELDSWFEKLKSDKKAAELELPSVEERDQEARLFFKRLEDGEPDALEEWKEFRETSIREFMRVYERMGIEFYGIEGESFYTDVLEEVVRQVETKPGTKTDAGALIVDMPSVPGEPPVLLKTKDGTTLYITRDIAAATDRYERFNFSRNLYAVAADQSLHFRQLFRTLAAMGHDWAENCKHVEFGRVHGMSTRKGKVVFLDEVLDEAVTKAREICESSQKIPEDKLEETIEAIGVGSIIFGDLKNLRTSDYTFRWEDVVNFEGLTGPYVQYMHARTCSVLRKAGELPKTADVSLLALNEERNVLMALAHFPQAIEDACNSFEPSLLTRNLLDLAQATAQYLTAGNKDRSKRILLEDEPELRDARLHLVDALRQTLRSGLAILGVKAPEAM
ncbi:MAG: arginine--tRNA ligase [Myxococcota bacterium]|nr:arginine--tRNA ligase [Myxococcota bacterium]